MKRALYPDCLQCYLDTLGSEPKCYHRHDVTGVTRMWIRAVKDRPYQYPEGILTPIELKELKRSKFKLIKST